MALQSDVLVPGSETRERLADTPVRAARPALSPSYLPPLVDLLALTIGMGFVTAGSTALDRLYLAAAFAALIVVGSGRIRIAPSVSTDLPRLLTALTVPAVAAWIAARAARVSTQPIAMSVSSILWRSPRSWLAPLASRHPRIR